MKDLLLEIGVEEIPSAYMPGAIKALQELSASKFLDFRLDYKEIKTYGTPRRLVLWVSDLAERQKDAVIENRGPKKSIAFDSEGQPAKPGLGFARAQGVAFGDLIIKEVDGIEYLFAVKKALGHDAGEIMPGLLQSLINSIVFPKSMRWGYFSTRFARPIRWLMAMFGDELIPISIENIKSERTTYGHRFLSSGPLALNGIGDYFTKLAQNYVILDQEKRKNLIWEQVVQVAAGVGGKPVEDSDLLEEVNFLVEYPTAFWGEFSPSYLSVPPEVLTTSMIEHQRYFPVFDAEGKLMAGFIGVRNGTDYQIDTVRAGNERVLKARLEDALFFWNEDTRKSLDDLARGFKDVLFHERLGTLDDKVKRLEHLAVDLGNMAVLSNPVLLERAAALCKADLLSSMVYEFPELQGVMGRYYASKMGEDSETCEAILEHYLPRYSGDRLPETSTGIILSLAEKLDNLVGCFSIGIRPTGSQDPYALRRQALGLVNIVLERSLELDVKKCILSAYDDYKPINPDFSKEDTMDGVWEFIQQRLRGLLLDRGYAYDVIDSVLQLPISDINDLHTRVHSVQRFKESVLFNDLMVVFNRSSNLSRKWENSSVDRKVLVDPSEIELFEAYQSTAQEVEELLSRRDYCQALLILASLRSYVDAFFAAVMVMVDDEKLKASRLGMLKSISGLCEKVADFSKLVY